MSKTASRLFGWFVGFILIGCSQNAAEWDAKKIESWIKTEWNMDSVHVVQNNDRKYSGSGSDKAGRKFTFLIEQDAESEFLRVSRIDEQGNADGKAIRHY